MLRYYRFDYNLFIKATFKTLLNMFLPVLRCSLRYKYQIKVCELKMAQPEVN